MLKLSLSFFEKNLAAARSNWTLDGEVVSTEAEYTFVVKKRTSMEKSPYIELAECLLPEEMVEYFEVVKVEKTAETLDVTLEERDNGVAGYEAGDLRPNGFYEESVVRDYPVRGRKMSFHVRRRRWVEIETGKSVSRQWDLVAEGTRFSKEFAAFLKGMLGQIPDYGPLS